MNDSMRLGVILLLTAALLAQRDTGGLNLGLASIQGRVQFQDDPNRPLEQVAVELRRSNGTPISTAYTSGNGQFLFQNLATGGYQIAVTLPGYQSYTEKVSVSTASGRIYLQVHLRRKEAAAEKGGAVSLREMRAPPAARREFERGLEQVRRGDTAAAERFLRKAVEIYPAYTRAWVELGRLHAAAHRADQALECFDAALRHDPADPEALRGTARLLNDRGRHLEALRAAAQLEQLGSGDARSHLEIARGLLGAGKPAEAEAAARRLESEPHAQAPEVHLVLYQIAQSRQDQGAAAAELRAYLKEVGESAAPHARQALDRLEAELAATPSAEDLSNEGARLAQAGQVDQAIDAYQRALRLNPGLTPVQLNLGIAYFRAGRYAEAEAPLRRFLSVNAGHAQALHLLGLCLLEQQTYADAAAQLAAARAAGASDFALLFALAVAYQRGGQPEQAQAAARALLEERGDSAEAHLLLGIGHAQGNENEKAVEAFQAARRVNPKLPWVHKWLAETLMKMNREDEAVPLYREELRINSRDSEANYQLGAILERRNQDAEAETLLSNALRFRPEYGEASYTLGKLYLRQNRLDPARPLLERAARLLPDNPSAHYQLGRLYQRLGRAREAQEQFAITEKLQQAAREKARDAILP